ncbi:uncharacterized protein LOC103523953 [Nephila pilipes]|uniref:Uncharacterized protein LOC103523953 n=1 Tax=Nephila pilipes TaxID=299642 RepID=A0A8X6UDI0_NEPPI|nr:uncharacterized protein LOC103523953 [Nephila pilipes]
MVIDARVDLIRKVKKRDFCPIALSAIALETIHTRFPLNEWLHICTDGSLLNFSQGAGAGIFSDSFSFYLHIRTFTTHFDGELKAIYVALQQCAVRLDTIERAVIFSDSVSALQAQPSNCESLRVQRCRVLLKEFKGKVSFQCALSHCGLRDNEAANFLAKKGAAILQKSCTHLLLHSAKWEIKRIFKQLFHHATSPAAADKSWSVLREFHCVPNSPRTVCCCSYV